MDYYVHNNIENYSLAITSVGHVSVSTKTRREKRQDSRQGKKFNDILKKEIEKREEKNTAERNSIGRA